MLLFLSLPCKDWCRDFSHTSASTLSDLCICRAGAEGLAGSMCSPVATKAGEDRLDADKSASSMLVHLQAVAD